VGFQAATGAIKEGARLDRVVNAARVAQRDEVDLVILQK
jgi:hypothetical protein